MGLCQRRREGNERAKGEDPHRLHPPTWAPALPQLVLGPPSMLTWRVSLDLVSKGTPRTQRCTNNPQEAPYPWPKSRRRCPPQGQCHTYWDPEETEECGGTGGESPHIPRPTSESRGSSPGSTCIWVTRASHTPLWASASRGITWRKCSHPEQERRHILYNGKHQIPRGPQGAFPDFSLGVGLCWTRDDSRQQPGPRGFRDLTATRAHLSDPPQGFWVHRRQEVWGCAFTNIEPMRSPLQ